MTSRFACEAVTGKTLESLRHSYVPSSVDLGRDQFVARRTSCLQPGALYDESSLLHKLDARTMSTLGCVPIAEARVVRRWCVSMPWQMGKHESKVSSRHARLRSPSKIGYGRSVGQIRTFQDSGCQKLNLVAIEVSTSVVPSRTLFLPKKLIRLAPSLPEVMLTTSSLKSSSSCLIHTLYACNK